MLILSNGITRQATPEEIAEIEADHGQSEPVPTCVTRLQGRLALIEVGLFDRVQPMIDVLPYEERLRAQVYWDDALNYERHNPVLLMLADLLGLDSDALDDLFRMAAKL
jgi:hypothetical protein